MAKKQSKVPTLTEAELREILGEAIHTGFRKGSDHASADRVWKAIHDMPSEEWGKAVDWIAWSLFYAKKRG